MARALLYLPKRTRLMKKLAFIIGILVAAALLSTSCATGYLVAAEPDVVVYEDARYSNLELLWLLEYGIYHNRPYYHRARPLPPPPPAHKPKPQPKPNVAPPPSNHGGQPMPGNRSGQPRVQPNRGDNVGGGRPPQQNHGGGAPRTGGAPRSGGSRGR